MFNYLLVIEYDGTNFVGWQIQKNGISIQEKIQNALKKVLRSKIQIVGSGRTDKGVHAYGQCANFKTKIKIKDKNKFINSMNFFLHNYQISLLNIKEKDTNFHSRFDAIDRTYSYLIFNNPSRNVLLEDFYYWEQSDLDVDKINEESQCLIGKHNFTSFRSLSCGSSNPERNIKKIEINKLGNIIEIKITANAFLQNMVRIIVGTLLEIGKDQIKTPLREILESKDRNNAGITINPRGLIFLGPNYKNITKLNPENSPLIRI